MKLVRSGEGGMARKSLQSKKKNRQGSEAQKIGQGAMSGGSSLKRSDAVSRAATNSPISHSREFQCFGRRRGGRRKPVTDQGYD